MCKIESSWEAATEHKNLNSVLCDDLESWDGGGVGGRSKREGIYVHIQLISEKMVFVFFFSLLSLPLHPFFLSLFLSL